MKKSIVYLLFLFLPVSQTFANTDALKEVLSEKAETIGAQLSKPDGASAFKEFLREIVEELKGRGATDKAKEITKIFSDGKIENGNVTDAASIVASFTRAYYRDEIIESTRALIQFKTFATGVPNRMNPEFKKQKEFLAKLASKLGLNFRDVGGYVQEIWIGAGPASFGLMVYSADPETGHNALMDLVVLLDRNVKPIQNNISLMAKFAATYIGLELDGAKLGIKHEDDFMGKTTVSANMFETKQDTVLFMFNYRLPKGIALAKVEEAVKTRFRNFAVLNKTEFVEKHYFSAPLYNDPESPFVQKLLSIFNEATGGDYKAESIGGGTYAKRIPNSVVFDPALPGHEYTGHQPDEFISLETLERNIEVLSNTLVRFGVWQIS